MKKKQQKDINSWINLPEDVLINNILLKLDTKTLMKLRCVCKYLHSSITRPNFVKMHCHYQLNNNPLVLLVSDYKNRFYSLNFNGTTHDHISIDRSIPKRVDSMVSPFSVTHRIFGSCNGLLGLVDRTNHSLSLWNPTTKEYKMLPPPITHLPNNVSSRTLFVHSKVSSYGFGYDRIIDDYKVIECGCTNWIIDFQVYTLGTNTWRRINDNPYKSYFKKPNHNQTPGIFLNGALHWILSKEIVSEYVIIAFDIEKEIFRVEVPTPPHFRLSNYDITYFLDMYHSDDDTESFFNRSISMLSGCLCVYESIDIKRGKERGIDVWMMKDYGVMESWTKLFRFASYCRDFKVLDIWENGEFLVVNKCYGQQKNLGLFLYDPINNKGKEVHKGKHGICYTESETYIESFVSLNTGIYKHGEVENKHSKGKGMKRKRH